MKKILPFLLLLSLGARSQTSVYHPFPDSSALWNFDRDFFCQFFLQYEHYSIQITGDTTISNQTYHRLNTPSITTDNPNCIGWGNIGYRGAIRQDTAMKKVYYVQPTDVSSSPDFKVGARGYEIIKNLFISTKYPVLFKYRS